METNCSILGQKWGVRRYQNPDGTLNELGRCDECGASSNFSVRWENKRLCHKCYLKRRYEDGEKIKEENPMEENPMNNIPKYERHNEILSGIHETYIQKNEAYGDSFNKSCDEFGVTAALVRMEDKWNRLKNLVNHPDISKGDEAIEDTLLDLANYCVMTKMWLETRGLKNE